MMSYDPAEKALFSADGFGRFGALDADESWDDEARRYYIGIVGKFGAQVQAVLQKLSGMEIRKICPLHGPVLTENIGHCIDLYNTWSSYRPESKGVMIAYTTVYGHTKEAVLLLADKLREKGCPNVEVFDLARDPMDAALAGAFRYGKIVLATTTYNTEIFPFMQDFITRLTAHGFKNRTVALIENGSWGPMAAKVMRKQLETCEGVEIPDPISIRGAMTGANRAQIAELAAKLA